MGAGIKAKNAPNFPGTKKNVELTIQYFRLEDNPKMITISQLELIIIKNTNKNIINFATI